MMIKILKKCLKILNRKQQKKLGILLFMMVIGAGLETFSVSLIIPYVTRVSQAKPSVFLTWLIIVAFGGKNVYLYVLKCLQNHFIIKNCSISSLRLFETYLKKPYEYFLYHNSNKIITVINVYVTKAFVLINEVLNLTTECIVFGALFLFMLTINYKVTFAMVFFMALISFFIKIFINPRLRKIGKKSNDAYEEMVMCVSHAVNGIKEIKIFDVEDVFLKSYKKHADDNVRLETWKYIYSFIPKYLSEFTAISGVLILILISTSNEITGADSVISQAAVFSFVIMRLLPAVIRINNGMNQIAYYMPSLMEISDEVIEYIRTENRYKDKVEVPWKFNDSVCVSDVTFSYNEASGKTVLNHVEFNIYKGDLVGIIGESGAGKTTLANILLGYLIPESGTVLVDGIDIHSNLRGWLKNVGYIPQMIFLLDDSIRANVIFGAENSTDEEVWRVLDQVRLADFVRELPEGLNTCVGEGGIRLSGGQRQRLGIARALFRNPEILVLDEATASLDNKLEQEVMESVYGIAKEKTVIIIAHRLTTLSNCNKIYKVSDGKVVLSQI